MGGDPTEGSFEGLNVWEYFNSDCYEKFDDSETGFYTVYRRVFDTLAAEEEKFDEEHKVKAADLPTFGKKDSEEKEVNAFYNFWLHFVSQKSFSWKDLYRTSDVRMNQHARDVIYVDVRFQTGPGSQP
jgi:DnaJ homolog subfamily A member 5